MNDFFGKLEVELRAAAERPPRRAPALPDALRGGLGALAVAAAVVVALVPVLLVLGGGEDEAARPLPAPDRERQPQRNPGPAAPVGTVIPKGEGYPPRQADSTVVARGESEPFGPWQMEAYASTRLTDDTGEEIQPAGLRCIGLILLDPPNDAGAAGGACGEQPATPGFSRIQLTIPRRVGSRPRALLVYGRVPERAATVQFTIGDLKVGVHPSEGPPGVRGNFYFAAVPPEEGRVNWLDADGKPGSRGTALLPP